MQALYKGFASREVVGLITWAQSERPDVVLIIVSGFLSNPAKDWLECYEEKYPPFRIKYWERRDLARLVRDNQELLARYQLGDSRTRSDRVRAFGAKAPIPHPNPFVCLVEGRAHHTNPGTRGSSRAQKARSDRKPAEAYEFLHPMHLMTFNW